MCLEEVVRANLSGHAWSQGDRVQLADGLRIIARTWLPPPKVLAVAFSVEIDDAPLPECAPFALVDGVILRRAQATTAEKEIAAYAGIASLALSGGQQPWTVSDVWLLAAELAAPSLLLSAMGPSEVAVMQRWVPAWIVHLYASVTGGRASGVGRQRIDALSTVDNAASR